MWTNVFLEYTKFKFFEVVNYKNERDKKRDLIFLKNKNYFFYKYWYPFYLKRKKAEIIPVPDFLEIIFPINRVKANSIGEAVFGYYVIIQQHVIDNTKSLLHKSRYSNLMLYYTYNAGLKKSLNLNLEYEYSDYKNMVILDFRFKKPRVFFIKDDRCVFSLSSGIILKKLDIKEKNAKKTQRVVNVMIKTILKKVISDNNQEIVIFIKGVKSNFIKTMSLFNEFSEKTKFFFMWNFCIRRNNIRFKKIKAIKRNLTKKFQQN